MKKLLFIACQMILFIGCDEITGDGTVTVESVSGTYNVTSPL